MRQVVHIEKYSQKAQAKIKGIMHEYKEGMLTSGPKGKDGKVTKIKQEKRL